MDQNQKVGEGVPLAKASGRSPSGSLSLGSPKTAELNPTGTSRAHAQAERLAADADEHYRFSKATRREVAYTAVRDLMDEVVPIIPTLQRMVASDELPSAEHNAICDLLEYLNVKP